MKMLTVLLLVLPALASADPHFWMKKDDPESLYISGFSASDCPLSTEEVEKETRNVLIRSRIKPMEGGGIFGYPYLSVDAQCMKFSGSTIAVSFTIDFVGLIDLNNPLETKSPMDRVAEMKPAYVRFGKQPITGYILTADKEYLRSTVRKAVEDFMADYLQANFDLGEDE